MDVRQPIPRAGHRKTRDPESVKLDRQILLIENDVEIAGLVISHFQRMQAEVTLIHCRDNGLDAILTQSWDLIVLCMHFPSVWVVQVGNSLRSAGSKTPIMIVGSERRRFECVAGLELGADDFLTVPFCSLELTARVKMLLKRADQHHSSSLVTMPESEPTKIKIHNLILDKSQRRVFVNKKEVELTSREFDLLWFFVRSPGKVFTRFDLLDNLWNCTHEGYEHTVSTHINRLRKKIESDASNPTLLLTVWGVGYKFLEDCQ